MSSYTKKTKNYQDLNPENSLDRKEKFASAYTSKTDEHANMQTQMKSQHALKKKQNETGIPDKIKNGIENLSGMSLDHVKVHYNSTKPASLRAHAFAKGNNIHLASGQEKHLPHEAWHVVQQMQGRVKPTTTVAGMPVNDNPKLENEADIMGSKASENK